jgi:hypothetical protein
MDQCEHCTLKGDIEKCKLTTCNFHALWMVQTILAENAKLKEELKIQQDSYTTRIGEMAEEKISQHCILTTQIQKHQMRYTQLRKSLTDTMDLLNSEL